MYVVGGTDGAARSTLYAYDPAVNTWSTLAPMPTARDTMGVFVRGGCIYAVGGRDADYRTLNTVERYDPATNNWTAMRPFPNAITSLQCCTVAGDDREIGEADFFDALIARAEAVGRRDQ